MYFCLFLLVVTCHLLITFANSLDPDHAQQNVGHDLGPNCLTPWWYSWENFWKKRMNMPGPVAQSVASQIADLGVVSYIPARPHTFMESWNIFLGHSPPLIQKGLLSVTRECMTCALSTGELLSLPNKSVVRLTDRLYTTIAVYWDIRPQTKQQYEKTKLWWGFLL